MPPKSAAPISISSLLDAGDDNAKNNKDGEYEEVVVIDDTEDEEEDGDKNEDPVKITPEEFQRANDSKNKTSISSILSHDTSSKDQKKKPPPKTRKPRAVTKKKEEEKAAELKAKAEAKAAKAAAKATRAAKTAKAKANSKSIAESDVDQKVETPQNNENNENNGTSEAQNPTGESETKDSEQNTKTSSSDVSTPVITAPHTTTPPVVVDPVITAVDPVISTPPASLSVPPAPRTSSSSTKPNILDLMNPDDKEPQTLVSASTSELNTPTLSTNAISAIERNSLGHPKPMLAAVSPLLHFPPTNVSTALSAGQLAPQPASQPFIQHAPPPIMQPIVPTLSSQSPVPSPPQPPTTATTATTATKTKPKTAKAPKKTDPKDVKDTKKDTKPKKETKKGNNKKEDEKKELTPTPVLTQDKIQNLALQKPNPNSTLTPPSFVEIQRSNEPTESPKESTAEAISEPIIALNIPLLTEDQERGTAQVVFNVLKMTEDKYGWKNVHPNASKFAMDLMNDDDMEDDDDADGAAAVEEEEEEKEQPVKVDGRSLQKGKPKIGQYDVNDPFIDDAEMLYEEQRASTKDGFFVFYGPLVEEGKNARIERADGTIKRSRKRVAGITNVSTQPKKKPNNSVKVQPIAVATGPKNLVPIAIAPSLK